MSYEEEFKECVRCGGSLSTELRDKVIIDICIKCIDNKKSHNYWVRGYAKIQKT